jgi:hypothetical protein
MSENSGVGLHKFHCMNILFIHDETAVGVCCYSAKHAALRSKNKDWLARNQDNVSE